MPQYDKIFDQRGQLYHQAMQENPTCREQEFTSVVEAADIAPGMTVVDVPSGGAYLADYLPGVNLIGLETSLAFAELAKGRTEAVLLYGNNSFPLPAARADRVLSIAGLHHMQDKEKIFSEMRRILKPDGRLVAADVHEDSPVRRFLDDFVGQYCETGHSGWYFGDATRTELRKAGFAIIADTMLDYVWHAPDRRQLVEFCRTLFGMVRADHDTVDQGIGDYLGFTKSAAGIGFNWQLHCFTCETNDHQELGG